MLFSWLRIRSFILAVDDDSLFADHPPLSLTAQENNFNMVPSWRNKKNHALISSMIFHTKAFITKS